MEKICGIYCIQNIRNSKRYIGYSVDIKIRWSDHRCDLKYNRHDNDYLQASYNKYGLENFVIYLIEECDKSKLKEREIYYIQYFDSANKSIGYNLTKGGDGIVGVERSKEWGDNISKGNKGRTFTKEHKENLRIAHLGYVAPQSQRDNLAIAVSGKKKAKNTSSKYVGVAKVSGGKKWRSYIFVDGKQICLGRFENEIDAARAYNIAAIQRFGANAKINDLGEE